jgi:hypothetical protein
VRSKIENRNGVLRRYMSLSVARAWRHIAAWQGYLSVLSWMIMALSNVWVLLRRIREKMRMDPNFNPSPEEIQALLCLIASYVVERDRVNTTIPP